MTGFDIVVLLLVGLGAITGFMRGFVQESLALLAWVAAVLAINYGHEPLSHYLLRFIETPSGAAVLAFAVLMLVPYLAVRMIARWMGILSRNSLLGPVDRVLGFGFGTLKGMIIVVLAFSVFVLGYDTVWGPAGRPAWITESRTYPFVNAASNELVTLLAERRRAAAEAERKASPTDEFGIGAT